MPRTLASLLATVALGSLLPLAVHAADLHDGDIEISVVNNQLKLSGNHVFHADGSPVFEGDFGDFAGGPYLTDDPGYDSENGTFLAGTVISYTALGSLKHWNGSAWQASVPGNEYVRMDGNFGEESRWTVSGLTGDTSGLVGQAGNTGKIHEHLDLRVARVGGGAPAAGAYLVQLQLTADNAYQSSTPYYMAMNRGLTVDAFETAVGALAPVPEPQTWALMMAGLVIGALALRNRRH